MFLRGCNGNIDFKECPEYLIEKIWKNLSLLDKQIMAFHGIEESLTDKIEEMCWKEVMEAVDPWLVEMPSKFQNSLDSF